MASIGRALVGAIDKLASTATIRQFVTEVGGTREASELLGVTQRTVQRYITNAGERRGQGNTIMSQRARRRVARARIREEGVYVPEGGFKGKIKIPTGVSKRNPRGEDERERETGTGFEIGPEAMEGVIDALERGDEHEAGVIFGDAFVSAYTEGDAFGELSDVEWLELEYGGGES